MEPEFKPSSDRAIAWAKAAIKRKRAEQQKMIEEYKTNNKLQEVVAKLREQILQQKNGSTTLGQPAQNKVDYGL